MIQWHYKFEIDQYPITTSDINSLFDNKNLLKQINEFGCVLLDVNVNLNIVSVSEGNSGQVNVKWQQNSRPSITKIRIEWKLEEEKENKTKIFDILSNNAKGVNHFNVEKCGKYEIHLFGYYNNTWTIDRSGIPNQKFHSFLTCRNS